MNGIRMVTGGRLVSPLLLGKENSAAEVLWSLLPVKKISKQVASRGQETGLSCQ